MARIARVVVPGMPHHITQRGNRRLTTFFCDDDYHAYLELMAHWCRECHVDIWAYCLMPNHVHLIAVPESESALRQAVGEAHRRYTRRVSFRERWRGHLWQGRFASFVMDEPYLLAAARYIELNPVRARLAVDAGQFRWSSAAAHLAAKGQVKDAMWSYLWVDVVYNQDKSEHLKAMDRLKTVFTKMNDQDHVEKYTEKLNRLR